jgi:hypothetical protein
MKMAIEDGGKKKVTRLEREKILNQNRIRTLEKKVQELAKIDDLNQNLLDLGKSVRILIGTEPELMIANNLVKQVYNDDNDPKLVKIISCNKKYVAEIQAIVGKLSASIDASLEYLVAHVDDLDLKTEDVQVTEPELKRVPDISGTGLKRLSGTMVVQTPTGSTSSASTPPFLRSLSQATPQSTPVKLLPVLLFALVPGDVKQFMKESEDKEVKDATLDVDVVTVAEAPVAEEAPVVTQEVFSDPLIGNSYPDIRPLELSEHPDLSSFVNSYPVIRT